MDSQLVGRPVFVLSLDLELFWGLTGTQAFKSINLVKSAGGTKLRKYINFQIDVLEKYRIQATWAIVGHLLVDSCNTEICQRLNHRSSSARPHLTYAHEDSYTDSLYSGRDILERILSSNVEHEIACHSFSHAIFSKIGEEAAELEIRAGVESAKPFGISFKSFVFPKNEIGHIDLLKKYGFIIYRGMKKGQTPREKTVCAQKVADFVDEMIASPVTPEWKRGIWEIQSSMMFCDPKYPFSLLPRAKLGLARAIRSSKVFHVWMHPWDLLRYNSLPTHFEQFIKYVCKMRNEQKIDVMTMKDLAEHANTRMNT